MTPKGTKRIKSQLKTHRVQSITRKKFNNTEAKKIFLYNQGQKFILELGFDPASSFCNDIWELVQYHKWYDFCRIPKKLAFIPILLEFYSNLKYMKSDRVIGRNKKVDTSPNAICKRYGVPMFWT